MMASQEGECFIGPAPVRCRGDGRHRHRRRHQPIRLLQILQILSDRILTFVFLFCFFFVLLKSMP